MKVIDWEEYRQNRRIADKLVDREISLAKAQLIVERHKRMIKALDEFYSWPDGVA